MKKNILFLSLLIFISCADDKNKKYLKESFVEINLDQLKPMQMFGDNGCVGRYEFIKLETTDDCLIGQWIQKLEVKDNLIFIKDNNGKIFVFDMNGHFKNTIGNIGEGPNEMVSLIDFYVDERHNRVVAYDMMRSLMFEYSYDGKLLKKEKCDNSVIRDFSKMTLMDDGKIVLTMSNDLNSKFNYRLLNSDYSLNKECLPFFILGEHRISFDLQERVTNSSECYATSLFSDTIYGYKDDSFFPAFVFNSGLKRINSEILKNQNSYETAADLIPFLHENGYSTGISDKIYSMKDYLHFIFFEEGTDYKIFWNIKKQKGFYIKNHMYKNVFTSFYNMVTTTPEALVCALPVELILSDESLEYAKNDPRIEEIIRNTQEDDNPVIGFYYLK